MPIPLLALAGASLGLGALSSYQQAKEQQKAAEEENKRQAIRSRWSVFTGRQPGAKQSAPSAASAALKGALSGGITGLGLGQMASQAGMFTSPNAGIMQPTVGANIQPMNVQPQQLLTGGFGQLPQTYA